MKRYSKVFGILLILTILFSFSCEGLFDIIKNKIIDIIIKMLEYIRVTPDNQVYVRFVDSTSDVLIDKYSPIYQEAIKYIIDGNEKVEIEKHSDTYYYIRKENE